jgi:Asp-tRNA(Asn)/Glu-tRNA(Gln) amidotransferase A subunit family amidase
MGITATEAVRQGRLSARQAAEQALARIAEHDHKLGAFRIVREQRALAEAGSIDAHPDRATMPLARVPLAIKDNVAVAGEAMRGSAGSSDAPQRADHEVVRRLRTAGAVVVGLTNVPECACSAPRIRPRASPGSVESEPLVGRPGSEAALLTLAAQLERLRPWQRLAPGY